MEGQPVPATETARYRQPKPLLQHRHCPKQWFSTGARSPSPDIWHYHYKSVYVGVGGRGAGLLASSRGRDAINHPTVHRTVPKTMN